MPANTQPIFPLTPLAAWAVLTAANTGVDGTGTVSTVFTAGTDGGRIDFLKLRARGTNVATVLRVFLNNGGTNATATNNALVAECALPATTGSNAAETGTDITIPLNMTLPGGYKVNVTVGTTVSGGWQVTGLGGSF